MKNLLLGLLVLLLAACTGSTPRATPTTSQSGQATPTKASSPVPSQTTVANETTVASPAPSPGLTPSPVAPTPPQATTKPAGLPDPSAYTWQPVASGLDAPVGFANAGDDSGRLFILEKAGTIRIVKDGQLLPAPFLNIRDRVGSQGSEQGLLGLAFHPNYTQNGYFYVNYTGPDGNTVIARFQVSPDNSDLADPGSETRLLSVDQPYPNHNGGMLAFGPDGYLYLSLGDGGSEGDPQGNGQSLNTLLGKILRIDVDHGQPYAIPPDNPFANGGGRPEIWAYGLRNPWRFSFDMQTHDLFIGDVGQNLWEEIDFLPAGSPGGANFGWNYFEGNHPYDNKTPPSGFQWVKPVAEYGHDQGCSVTGGVVYRGSQLPAWQGVYLYGDYCSGNVWGLIQGPQGSWENKLLYNNVGHITSFGQDEQGEVYLVDMSGSVYRLAAAKSSSAFLPLVVTPSPSQSQATPPATVTETPQATGIPNEAQAVVLLPSAQGKAASLTSAPRYSIQLNVDYAGHKFEGQSHVDYTNAENTTLDRLYFRLIPNGDESYGNGSLTVTQATLNGQPVATRLSHQNTVLEIPLSSALKPGGKAEINFQFSGLVPENFGGEATPSGYGIYNFSDGVMALSAWYPILAVYDDQGWNLDPVSGIGDSVYSDIAFYTVDLSAPDNLVVAATGESVSQSRHGANIDYHYESGPARDFFLILSPDFKSDSQIVDGTQVNSYFLPGNSTGGARTLSIAVDSLHVYNQRFGPYPYKQLDVVDAPMRNAAGVEFPAIILIGDFLYKNPEEVSFDVTVAHEVAHQWWYNVVGNDVFDDPWLDESLTSYSSGLFLEAERGTARGLINYWKDRYGTAVQKGEDDQVTASLAHFESLKDAGAVYAAIVYAKGPLFFDALRKKIGDKAFFEALQEYYQKEQYKIATPQDLLSIFEAASGRQLDDFYQQWLYSPKS